MVGIASWGWWGGKVEEGEESLRRKVLVAIGESWGRGGNDGGSGGEGERGTEERLGIGVIVAVGDQLGQPSLAWGKVQLRRI